MNSDAFRNRCQDVPHVRRLDEGGIRIERILVHLAMRANGIAVVQIARELIAKKLIGQEQVARNKLLTEDRADVIARYRAELPTAETLKRIRLIESRAASVYWSIWRDLPVNFPKRDLSRVPAHWLQFGTRVSPITASPRVAVNPPNAMLNYLYSVLESECRLGLASLGCDPGLGVLRLDTPARDSLACDLMEAVRPQVDAYVLESITRGVLKREWFAERPNGNCRLSSGACHSTLRDRPDVGACCCANCRMGCTSLLEFASQAL